MEKTTTNDPRNTRINSTENTKPRWRNIRGIGKRFSAQHQPEKENKKAWLFRYRVFTDLLDAICRFMTMTDDEIKKRRKKNTPMILELLALKQLKHMEENPKILLAYINKHVPDLPSDINVVVEEKDPLSTKEKIQRLLKIAEVTKKQIELGYMDENWKAIYKRD